MTDQQPVVPWSTPVQAATPGDPLDGADFEFEKDAVYKPATTRAKVAMGLVGLASALYAVDALLSLYGILLLANLPETTDAELVAYDSLVLLVGIVTFVVFIAAAVATWVWLYRLVKNVPALGGGTPSDSPRMAIVWWFVPFANFVKPYGVVKDAWQRLALSPAGKAHGSIRAWWVLYIGSNIASNVYARLPAATTIDAFNSQAIFNVIIDAAIIVSGVLFILIVRELEARSVSRAAAMPARLARETERQAEAAAAVERARAAVQASWEASRTGLTRDESADEPAGAPAAG